MPYLSQNEKPDVVKKMVTGIRNSINNIILQLDNVDTVAIKGLCFYSILESFAQDSANYTSDKKQKEIFSDFVLKYSTQTKYSFLNLVDPVTLYYRKKDELENEVVLNLSNGRFYKCSDDCIICPLCQDTKRKNIVTE